MQDQPSHDDLTSLFDFHMKLAARSAIPWLAATALFLICIILFYPALQYEFVNWDDIHYIEQDPRVTSLDPASLLQFFITPHLANWHPLTSLSLVVDYAIWGLEPYGFHLTSILLHASNTLLVFVLTLWLYGLADARKRNGNLHIAAATFAALLFTLHPLRVESVAWVSARKDVLFASFYLLSVIMFLVYRSPDSARRILWYLLSCLFFLFSLMSKPMAVSLPFVLFLLDFYPLRTGAEFDLRKRMAILLKNKYPFLFLLVCSVALTFWAQSQGGAVKSTSVVPLLERIPAAFHGYQFYIQKTLWPIDLAPFYPHPSISRAAHPYLEYLSAIALFSAAAWIGWRFRTRVPAFGIAFLIYVVTLLPVIGLVQVGGQFAADRYSYVPLIAPVSVFSYFLVRTLAKLPWQASSVALAALCLLLVLLVLQTRQQMTIWQDSVSLWSHEIAIYPNADALPYFNRGTAFESQNDPLRAISDYDRAILMSPGHYKALISRGILYAETGRYKEALDDFNRAVAINPGSSHAYADRGALYHRMDRLELALSDYLRATELDPGNAVAHYNASLVYRQMGRNSEADYHAGTAGKIGLPER